MYIAISDKGGKSGTCPDMQYHLPQHYLVHIPKGVSSSDVEDVIGLMRKTRIGVHIVGAWEDNEVIEYADIIERIEKWMNS